MSQGDLEAIEARIQTLRKELVSALSELRLLMRQRRALSAGYASGNKRRVNLLERNEEIRRTYQEAPERYGVIVGLGRHHKLSVRQIDRIIGSSAGRRVGRDALNDDPPETEAARNGQVYEDIDSGGAGMPGYTAGAGETG